MSAAAAPSQTLQQQQPQTSPSAADAHAPSSPSPSSSPLSSLDGVVSLELRFLLDHASVGAVLGRGGASVRAVREGSLCGLVIVKAEPKQNMERIMILKGDAQQIATAVKLCAQLSVHSLRPLAAGWATHRPHETALAIEDDWESDLIVS